MALEDDALDCPSLPRPKLLPIALNEMAPHVRICSCGFESFLPYMEELSTPAREQVPSHAKSLTDGCHTPELLEL